MADERWVLDALPEAIVGLDAAGNVTLVNDRAEALLGLGSDAVGRPVAEVLDLRDDAGVRCELPGPRPRVGDRLAERTLHLRRPHGTRPVALAGRWRDDHLLVTLRNAGRREHLDAVRGDVVATVSHEIRSPLTSVKGFTRTLLAKWERFSDDQKRAMLETIDADADRVTRLLKELLDVSRIDAGRVQLHRTRVDTVALVDRVVDRARVHEDAAERLLEVTADGAVPDLLADADKLEQVVVNLVENALRYAPEGPVTVGVRHTDGQLELVVRDHGPGIPHDQRRLVFQKFGRGREVRRAGTGLGLYISRGLVRAHGGTVEVEDADGGGAAIRVLLPADPVAPS